MNELRICIHPYGGNRVSRTSAGARPLSFGRCVTRALAWTACTLLLALASAAPALCQEREIESESYAVPEGFDPPPALLEALARMMRADDRWYILSHPQVWEGEKDRDEYESRIGRLREEFERLLPGRKLTDQQLVQMDLFRIGWQSFRQAREADEELRADDILGLVDPRFVRAPPIVPIRVWIEAQKALRQMPESRKNPDLVPAVGHVSLRFLLFGALHDDEFWRREQKPDAREEFLSTLLRRAADDPAVLQGVVDGALTPPLVWPDSGAKADFVTAAVNLPSLAGKVGFSTKHRDLVASLIHETTTQLSNVADQDRAARDYRHINMLDRRFRWLLGVSERIGHELGNETDPPHGGTASLAQRLDRWRDLANALSFDAFEKRIVDRIEDLFDPEFLLSAGDLPGDDRIRELVGFALANGAEDPAEVLSEGTGLTEEQKEELRRLLSERRQQVRDELEAVGTLLLAKAKKEGRLDDAEEALIEVLPEALARSGSDAALSHSILRDLWEYQAFGTDPSRLRALVQRVLLGDEAARNAPAAPLVQRLNIKVLMGTASAEDRAILQRVATESRSVSSRSMAIGNAPVLFGGQARKVYEKALNDALGGDPSLSSRERRSLLLSVLSGLDRHFKQRPQDPWLPEVAARLFGWDPTSGTAAESPFQRRILEPDDPGVREVWNKLPPSFRARIEAAGLGAANSGDD